jgi:hypothetical protein
MSTGHVTVQHYLGAQQYNVTLDPVPDECPICHHHVQSVFRYGIVLESFPTVGRGTVHVQAAFQCPRGECRSLFIAYYEYPHEAAMQTIAAHHHPMTLQRVAPQTFRPVSFPSEIAAVSAQFVLIYNEAAAAEAHGLASIVGPGYGKALEFLIKDYLISRHKGEEQAIKKEFLGNVIKNRVDDPRVQTTAERAAWLRNDETHYERKWENKDVQDLKRLITLTVNWIHSSLLTDELPTQMPAQVKGK